MPPQTPRSHTSPAISSRRAFLKTALFATGGLSLLGRASGQSDTPASHPAAKLPRFHIFSKHLQFLDFRDMAKAAADLGFDGVDLTVRPDGHVLPENVARDLPRAVAAIRDAGLSADMMTTAVDDASDPIDRAVLSVAAAEGIRFYRMNWLSYDGADPLPVQLERAEKRLAALSDLNRELGLVGCYQNHAGKLIGASIWELWRMLRSSDPQHFGIQYDIRHATVEGGQSWPNGLALALPSIRTIVLKDFKWDFENGRNQIVNTPLGEGGVDFLSYFKTLKSAAVDVPVSLHLEYDSIGGAQWGKRELSCPPQQVYAAMAKDLAAAKSLWDQA